MAESPSTIIRGLQRALRRERRAQQGARAAWRLTRLLLRRARSEGLAYRTLAFRVADPPGERTQHAAGPGQPDDVEERPDEWCQRAAAGVARGCQTAHDEGDDAL